MKQDEKLEIKERKLVSALRALPRPHLSSEESALIKNRLMAKLEFDVSENLSEVVSEMGLDSYKRAVMKERIFALIETVTQKKFGFFNFFVFHKKLVSAFVLFLMAFSIVPFANFNGGVVMAETFSILGEYKGEVFIERGGERVDVYAGMQIKEADKICTGADGFASIKFFDDSVSRLANDTEVVVNKLFRPELNSVKSYVEISLLSGNVWSRVVNLVERQSSFVVKANDISAATKKAAFNVEVIDDEVTVGVFKHFVDVETSGVAETVVRGQKVVLNDVGGVKVEQIKDSEESATWVSENLSDDQKYLAEVSEKLLVSKMETVGVKDINDDFGFSTSVNRDAVLLLTLDDVQKSKDEIDLVERDFVAAELMLESADLSPEKKIQAEEVLANFYDKVSGFYKLIDEVKVADNFYAIELKKYIDEKLLVQKKNLSLVLPDSPSYKAKGVIDDLELLGADDPVELAGIKNGQIISKLSEVDDLIDKGGDQKLAEGVIDEYKSDVGEVIGMIDDIDDSVKKEQASSELSGGLSLLSSIDVVDDSDVLEVKEELSSAGIEVSADVVVDEVLPVSQVVDEESADFVEVVAETIVPSESVVPDVPVMESLPEIDDELAETYGVTVEGGKILSPLLEGSLE